MLIPNELAAASLDARDRLARFARDAATSNTGSGAGAQSTMARAAGAAIFADALDSAIHARLEELKTVEK